MGQSFVLKRSGWTPERPDEKEGLRATMEDRAERRPSLMTDSGVPEPVRQFLLDHVGSVEQLEVLLLLRSAPDRVWSAEEVNRELGSSVSSIRDRLALLASQGFLSSREEEGRVLYRFDPGTQATRDLIDALATVYRERRLTVIDLIYARPPSDAVSFSEAFKLARRKGEP
jgi:hypothetical protein